MATATQADIPVTTSWVDIVTVNGALADASVNIQNKSGFGEMVFVVWGGSEPSSETAGMLLGREASVTSSASAIWIRGPNGGSSDDRVGVTLV